MSENKKKYLNDEELKEINGGFFAFPKKYKSKDSPAFEIGEEVIVLKSNFFSNSYKHAKILNVLSKSHYINGEYRYEVIYDDGTKENDVYESQMMERNGSLFSKRIKDGD